VTDLQVVALSSEHDRKAFSSTEESLTRYVQQQSSQDIKRGLARVYVLVQINQPQTIIGYFTLSATSLRLASIPEASKIPYELAPAILIGRLALNQSFQGQGLGAVLLRAAIERCLMISDDIGAYAVVVDALHDHAAAFYQHHGFQRLEANGLQLFVTVKAARNQLGH
jgi:GNAT superfamily N-acetyltransferase